MDDDPQLFAILHPATTRTQPTQSSVFPPQRGGLHRPESIIIIVMMDRKEWQLFVQTVQLLDSVLELGTLTEQPRRSSCDPDRDHLLLRRSQEPHSGKQEIPV
jgi:hypothetical protein